MSEDKRQGTPDERQEAETPSVLTMKANAYDLMLTRGHLIVQVQEIEKRITELEAAITKVENDSKQADTK